MRRRISRTLRRSRASAARALKADYRIALTGTPVENHVGELWSIMEFLNPGLLGSQAEFKKFYFAPIDSATRRPPSASRASLGPSCCAGSRPISPSSGICPTSSR